MRPTAGAAAARPADASPEHEFEAQPGLPQPLPAGERLLWQGAPGAWALARDALHLRGVALYFALLLAWRGTTVLADGSGLLEALQAVAVLMPLAVIALGLLALMAWLVSRTTLYTITDRRVVLRIGVVLGITFNLPYTRIDGAALRPRHDGSGDITLTLAPEDRIAYLHLWPHARPWHLKRTQPMLRSLANAAEVATLLSQALAAAAGQAHSRSPVVAATPPRQAGPGRSAEPLAA